MPTPARSATAAIGAPGSATNTARAASRIRWSFRAASARRPLIGAAAVLMAPGYHRNELFRSTRPRSALRHPAVGRLGGEPVSAPGRVADGGAGGAAVLGVEGEGGEPTALGEGVGGEGGADPRDAHGGHGQAVDAQPDEHQ